MELNYTYWKSNDGWYVGYLNIWPDHLTQGNIIPVEYATRNMTNPCT